MICQDLIVQCRHFCPFNDSIQLGSSLTKNPITSLQMRDNHNTVWDAVNEFKSTTASVTSLHESDWQVRPEKSAVIENKLLPTDAADRWQLLGIVKAVTKKRELPLCTWRSAQRLSGSRPGNSARAPGSQREPPGGTEPPEELLLSAATSPPRPAYSHAALLLMRTRCVRRLPCEFSATADACLSH